MKGVIKMTIFLLSFGFLFGGAVAWLIRRVVKGGE